MSVSIDDHPWTEEEKQAVLQVRKELITKGIVPQSAISEIELIVATLNAKCRIDEAVRKYTIYYQKLLQEYGIEDVWKNHETLQSQWRRYAVAGLDSSHRNIMWINGGGGTPVEEERQCIHSSILYNFAVHADLHTLRNGVTMVIDTASEPQKKIGNEKKLQIAWQNFSTRAQAIYILGTTVVTRIAVNALIAFASLFTKSKVISRITFATVETVAKNVGGVKALPSQHGGDVRSETEVWVKERLANFPTMGI